MSLSDSKQQELNRKLVSNEVYACVSGMVEYIIKKSWEDKDAPFTWDDFTNVTTFRSEEFKDAVIDEINDMDAEELSECDIIEWLRNESVIGVDETPPKTEIIQHIKELDDEECRSLCNAIDYELDEYEENAEPYEYWIVSSWLIDKLKDHGEMVMEGENIWARQTTGQAILLDSVIYEIQKETEYGSRGAD